jgi:RND family efflux transporter MFP subunit
VAVAALLLASAWSSIVPARIVQTETALLREVETQVMEDIPEDEEAIIQAPGWLEAEPFSVYAAALAEGVIESILVLEGDTVTAGQPVAKLVPDRARIAVRKANAKVQKSQAQVAIAKASQTVIPAQIAAATATLHGLEDEYRRKASLVESGAVAEGPVERLRLRIEGAHAELARLQATFDIAAASVSVAEAATVDAMADLELAELTLSRMTVVAPIDGVVIERLTSPGSVVRFGNGEHGSHVLHLYDPKMIQVRADIPLADAAGVGTGQEARITVDLLPDTVFTGRVVRFVHRADLQKNTIEAKVHVDNPSHLLKPDMLARVRILPPAKGETAIRQRLPRVLVPEAAVVDGSVWLIRGESTNVGRAHKQAVRTGPGVHEGWIEILEGVRPGDRIITDTTGLAQGDRVRAADSGGAS